MTVMQQQGPSVRRRRRVLPTFARISEWLAAGNMDSGLYLMEGEFQETERAVGFKVKKHNEFGTLRPATCWFPKSQVQRVENDRYVHGDKVMWLVPDWLYKVRLDEGFDI